MLTPKVTRVNRIDIGMRLVEDLRRGSTMRDVPEESLMLTGDENIVDVDFSVFWVVKPNGAGDYLFNIQMPEGTVKAVAESAMREVVGSTDSEKITTVARQSIETAVQELMQKVLEQLRAGIQITQVQLQKVDPPTQVIDSLRDVQAARIDLERAQNEAQTYANRVVPEAKGRAAQILQAAEAYQEADRRRGHRPDRAFPLGLRAVQAGARRDPSAHVSRNHGAAVRRPPTRSSWIPATGNGGVVPYPAARPAAAAAPAAPQPKAGGAAMRLEHRRRRRRRVSSSSR